MGGLVTPVKVGILVTLGVVALFVFLSFIRGQQWGRHQSEYWATFDDASGLAPKSEVRIAGVQVGQVSSIQLVKGKAQVYIQVRDDVPVYPNAVISKQTSSFLGENLLDLDPGFSAPVEGGGPHRMSVPLPPGSEIPNVQQTPSMQEIFQMVGGVAADIQEVTHALRDVVVSQRGSIQTIVADLAEFSARLDDASERSAERIDTILINTEIVSRNLRQLTSGKSETVDEILANVRVITEQTRGIVGSLHAFMGQEGEGLSEQAGRLQGMLASLEQAAAHVDSIAARIDRGEGTVGKLVSDQELGEKVALALDGMSDYVGRLRNLQLEMSVRSEYYFAANSAKNTLGLRVAPAPDKYFLFEVVDDPLGFVRTETVVRSPPGQDEVANQEIRTTKDTLKISAEFAKRYSFFTMRFGLIESTGGLGTDFYLLNETFALKLDFFDFTNPQQRYPRVRALASIYLIPHLFVSGGVDNIFNAPRYDLLTNQLILGRDYFVGGGLYFTDEDLKVLFGAMPTVVP